MKNQKKQALISQLCYYYDIDTEDLENMLTRGFVPHYKEMYIECPMGDGDVWHKSEYVQMSKAMRSGIEKASEIYNFYVFADDQLGANYLDFEADLLVELYYDIRHLFFSLLSNREILSILDNNKSVEEIQDELTRYAQQKIKNQK